jgi:choline dehydrogenase-like flavoprotein
MAQTKVVIVGAGFGGLAAAKALGKTPAQIILIDRTNHHLFQPLLYQVATSVLTPSQIATPIRGIFRKQKNTIVILGEVTASTKTRKTPRICDEERYNDECACVKMSGPDQIASMWDRPEITCPRTALIGTYDCFAGQRRITTAGSDSSKSANPTLSAELRKSYLQGSAWKLHESPIRRIHFEDHEDRAGNRRCGNKHTDDYSRI